MVKVIVADLSNPKTKPRVDKRRVVGADGSVKTLRVVDSASPTFGADFRYLFEKNVERARRQNKQIIGKPDTSPAKSDPNFAKR